MRQPLEISFKQVYNALMKLLIQMYNLWKQHGIQLWQSRSVNSGLMDHFHRWLRLSKVRSDLDLVLRLLLA
jgi:hypothetical protein